MMASAQNYLNRPEILAEPIPNNGSLWVHLQPDHHQVPGLLVAVFGALLACVARSRQPVFRVLAASLAFIPAIPASSTAPTTKPRRPQARSRPATANPRTTAITATLADALIAAVPARGWQRISAGAGAHGPREYDWARIPVRVGQKRGRGHWLLARRSISDPAEIAYYACYGPRRSSTADLAWIAGSRWHIEEGFQQAKNEAGLDHYQVRSWRAWYAHITLSMLALAWLAASKAQAVKGEPAPATQA